MAKVKSLIDLAALNTCLNELFCDGFIVVGFERFISLPVSFVNRDLSLLFQGLFERRLLLSVAHYIGLQLLILPNQAFVSDF